MHLDARDRVRELTAILTVVSLALVFGTAGGFVPAGLLPHVDPLVAAIPHVNALLSASALVTIGLGVRAIRQGNIARHRTAMATTTVLFLGFLALYLYRIALEGPSAFPGPDVVYQFVYLPLLAVHILLAVASIPLVYYVLLLAVTRPVAAIRKSPHPRIGRVAASLWAVSFALGIVVYLMLYVVPWTP
jgi:putative membrane protein